VADWAILASTIADHAKAQEGLKYNSHAFLIPQPSAPQPTPARRPSSRFHQDSPAARARPSRHPRGRREGPTSPTRKPVRS
jgi:hypothetical protein